ncbi:DUF3025 domain-containing protein [Noviherbaspirillum sp. ST9]|uniref:DUF3025 domain-containing protein n=1 Tax=Noviherbaspirillum sp. ST9 TaxID=3401606 RepID=UPI003B5865C8
MAGPPFLSEIDWRRPWLGTIEETARPLLHADDWRDALSLAAQVLELRNHLGRPIRFVPQASLPEGMSYEAFISASGGVPTRDNLHDFFNALVWLTFPKIKVQLNALQAAEIARAQMQGATHGGKGRGRVRDAATLFDENAALLVTCNPGLLEALQDHRWTEALMTQRECFWRDCHVSLFGHALMEKLVRPYKAVTAHAWPVLVDAAFFRLPWTERIDRIDDIVAKQLEAGLTSADFTPLPVLGVPGWWEGQDAAFYADTSVFRPKRQQRG